MAAAIRVASPSRGSPLTSSWRQPPTGNLVALGHEFRHKRRVDFGKHGRNREGRLGPMPPQHGQKLIEVLIQCEECLRGLRILWSNALETPGHAKIDCYGEAAASAVRSPQFSVREAQLSVVVETASWRCLIPAVLTFPALPTTGDAVLHPAQSSDRSSPAGSR